MFNASSNPLIQRPQPQQQHALVVASDQGRIAVVDAQTGAIVWQRRMGRELGPLTQDGDRFFLALGAPLALRVRHMRASDEERRGIEAKQVAPTRLEARRLTDGALLWTFADWRVAGPPHVELDGGTLMVASRAFVPGSQTIYALDSQTGAVLWTIEGSECGGYLDRVVAARGGRAYIHRAGSPHRAAVLESHSGRELWSEVSVYPWILSTRGVLVAKPEPGHTRVGEAILLDATTGMEVSRAPYLGWLKLLSDEGIAYLNSVTTRLTFITAVDLMHGGEVLWRAEGEHADTFALDQGRLYFARLLWPGPVGEVGALDARTGAVLWTWRTPASTAELVRLWGRRAPAMTANGIFRSWRALATALACPNPRLRRGLLRNEVYRGQWRHPYALHSANNAVWLTARDGDVFVGTRLGLFALDGAHGTLRWHALPSADLSFVEPAAPSPDDSGAM